MDIRQKWGHVCLLTIVKITLVVLMKITFLFPFFVAKGRQRELCCSNSLTAAGSVKMESYLSVKIRAKTLTECSWFKSALINPSSMIENWW